jgi:hypothetical protein
LPVASRVAFLPSTFSEVNFRSVGLIAFRKAMPSFGSIFISFICASMPLADSAAIPFL